MGQVHTEPRVRTGWALTAPVKVLGGRRGKRSTPGSAHHGPAAPSLFPCPEQPAYGINTSACDPHSPPTTQFLSDVNFQACIHIFG